MRASCQLRPARLAAAGLAVMAALLLSTGARADDPDGLRGQVDSLRAANAGLASKTQEVLLELYALESRLGQVENRLATLEDRAAELERREESARNRLELARRDLARAEQLLATRLRSLYIDGEIDPLAILFAVESLDEAITALDSLGRLADQDKDIVGQLQEARATLKGAVRELAERRAETRALVGEARAARSALASAKAERSSYLAGLERQQALNASQISRLSEQAAASEARSRELLPPGGDEGGSAPAPPPGGRKLTVVSTAYCLRGTTASGIPAGPGVVAVDPAVIPLGTRMFVPGYGNGVAADTGSAIRGAKIDVWIGSCIAALHWGRRTVTITLR